MGRLVNVARWCYEVNYITEATAWSYIEQAQSKALITYSSWEQFSLAYAIGYGFWKGCDFSTALEIHNELMNNEKSPFKKVEWIV